MLQPKFTIAPEQLASDDYQTDQDEAQIAQLWSCTICAVRRVWGDGPLLDESLADPLLKCASCQRPTRHRFVRIVPASMANWDGVSSSTHQISPEGLQTLSALAANRQRDEFGHFLAVER